MGYLMADTLTAPTPDPPASMRPSARSISSWLCCTTQEDTYTRTWHMIIQATGSCTPCQLSARWLASFSPSAPMVAYTCLFQLSWHIYMPLDISNAPRACPSLRSMV